MTFQRTPRHPHLAKGSRGLQNEVFQLRQDVADALTSIVVDVDVPGRRDHSVNGASVDRFYTNLPILRTKTDTHPTGSYAGGGLGNKAILGHNFASPLLLSALVSIEFTAELLTPEQVPLTVNTKPYANIVVEMDPIGDPGNYSILLFGDTGSPLLLGVYSTPALNQHKCVWTAALAGSGVQVVNLKKMIGASPAPPGAVFVAASQGPVPPYISGSWPSWAYSIAGIVATYPLARIVNAYTADGGLPKSPNITSGLMLVIGSSSNSIQNAVRILDWKLNGDAI